MRPNDKIAVLGGGHGAHAMAADLSLRGFRVTMYEMPEFRHRLGELFQRKTIEVSGVMTGLAKLENVTSNIDEAVAGADCIAVVVPAFAHESYAKLLKGKVGKKQVIVLYPGAFGALVFRRVFGEEDCPVVAEVNNLPYDVRLTGPGAINLFGTNKINIGVLPALKSPELIEALRRIHPFERVYEDVIESGLSIVNPALHSGPCLLNIGPIEYRARGDFFLYEHGFTPSAAKLDVKLDQERKDIGKRFGYTLRPIEDFSGMNEGYTWKDLYCATHGNISLTPIAGPHDIFSRYLTEDAPFGLVPWSSLATKAAVPTPTIDAVVNIYCIVHERDWWAEGRTADKLGLAGMSVDQIREYVRTGAR